MILFKSLLINDFHGIKELIISYFSFQLLKSSEFLLPARVAVPTSQEEAKASVCAQLLGIRRSSTLFRLI